MPNTQKSGSHDDRKTGQKDVKGGSRDGADGKSGKTAKSGSDERKPGSDRD